MGLALRLIVAVALLGGCSRDNPLFDGTAGDEGGNGATGDSPSATTGSAQSSGPGPGPDSDEGSTTDRPSSDDGTGSPDTGTTTGPDSSTTGLQECVITIPVSADTFVSNTERGCEGAAECEDWTFTDTGARAIHSNAGEATILLLRFEADNPIGNVDAARVVLQVNSERAPPGVMEFQVLDSTSVVVDAGPSGPAMSGQPTWNAAMHGKLLWEDGSGVDVPTFESLYSGWAQQPLVADDEFDGVLDLELTADNLTSARAALETGKAVQVGVTFMAAAGIVAHAREFAGGEAMLVLDRC